MINIPEILVANGTGAILVLFLLLYRIRIAQTNQFDEKAYNFLLIVTFIATINETLSFIIDARPGFIFYILQYISNTICTDASVIVGYCWILLVSICRISYLSKHESHQKEITDFSHSINNYHNFINYQFIWKWHHLQYF